MTESPCNHRNSKFEAAYSSRGQYLAQSDATNTLAIASSSEVRGLKPPTPLSALAQAVLRSVTP